MSWLDRLRLPRTSPGRDEPGDVVEKPTGRHSPGLAALFEGLKDDGRHSILDLGVASSGQLRILGRYGQQMRFAGLVPKPPVGEKLVEALAPHPRQPYDVVFAWDVFDRLDAPDRTRLMEQLALITAPGARLYAFVDSSGAATAQPTRSTILAHDRILQEPVGRPEPARSQILPAQAERLLAPFAVTHAFTLRVGLREYVATKR